MGLSNLDFNILPYTISFGAVSTAVSIIFELFVKYILKIRRDTPSWTLWKWCVSVLTMIFLIAICNYLLIAKITGQAFSGALFIQALYSTLVIGIFPIILFGSMNVIRKLKLNQQIAQEIQMTTTISTQESLVNLPIYNSDKMVECDANTILYLESLQNYVQVYSIEKDSVEKKTIRNTLKNLEAVLKPLGIKRTHRSYLVNPNMIESISGNAQGLKLKLKNIDDVQVPVSRKYIPSFR